MNDAFAFILVFGPIWKIRKKSAQIIIYGIIGKIFIPEVIELDSSIIANLADIKNEINYGIFSRICKRVG